MTLADITEFALDVYDVVAYARAHLPTPDSARAVWNLPGIADTWEINLPALRRACESVRAITSFNAAYRGPLTDDDIRIQAAAHRLAAAIDALHLKEN